MGGDRARAGRRSVPGVAGVWLAVVLMAATTVGAEGHGVTITPEQPVSDVAVGGARFGQLSSSVASDGQGYLVAWRDSYMTGRGEIGDISAARLDADGTVLDPFGFDVSDGPYLEHAPSIAWNNGVYLVVWAEQVPEQTMPCCFPNRVNDIYGARVTPDGTVLDPGGFPIAEVVGSHQETPDVAPLGDGFLVVWADGREDGPGIRATRVSSQGAVVDQDGIDVSTGGPDKSEPAVASRGDTALVVWADGTEGNADIRGTRVAVDGTLMDADSFAVTAATGDQRHPATASDGTDFLVGWEDHRTKRPVVHTGRVTADADMVDPGGTPVARGGIRPTMASTGDGYLVAWTDIGRRRADEVRGQHVGADGTTSGSTSFLVGASGYTTPAAAAGPGGYLVTWDQVGNSSDIFANLVPASAGPADTKGILVSGAPNEQVSPAAAWDGTNYLVAWSDDRAGADIYASRVRPDGTILDGTGFAVSTADNSQVRPKVAWNGTTHLVVWQDYRSDETPLYGARVTSDGRVLDPDGIRLTPRGLRVFDVAIAGGGSDFLVVYGGYRRGSSAQELYVTRVAADGRVTDPKGILLVGEGHWPSVAGNGRTYLVTWSTGPSGERDVHAVLMGTGPDADPTPIVVPSAPGSKGGPHAASDGDDFFVVWTDNRPGDNDVYGARVTRSGSVLDPEGVAVATGAGHQNVSGLAWNGRHYVLDWTTPAHPPQHHLTRVAPDATVVDPAGIPVGDAPYRGLAGGPPGEVALLVERYLPGPPFHGSARAFIRFFRE